MNHDELVRKWTAYLKECSRLIPDYAMKWEEEKLRLAVLGLWAERHEEAIKESLEAMKWETPSRAKINKFERALDAHRLITQEDL